MHEIPFVEDDGYSDDDATKGRVDSFVQSVLERSMTMDSSSLLLLYFLF